MGNLNYIFPISAIIFETSFNCPGLSNISILSSDNHPALRSPLFITLDSMFTSIFPSETMAHTFLFLIGNLLKIIAATDEAPAPSETNFCYSIRLKIAVAISSSVTVIISSTYFRQRS